MSVLCGYLSVCNHSGRTSQLMAWKLVVGVIINLGWMLDRTRGSVGWLLEGPEGPSLRNMLLCVCMCMFLCEAAEGEMIQRSVTQQTDSRGIYLTYMHVFPINGSSS